MVGIAADASKHVRAYKHTYYFPFHRNELLDGAVVAIAADASKRASELGPDDWELFPLEDILEE